MNFSNTSEYLKFLEGHSEVSINDILEFFKRICDDVKFDTGLLVAELSVSNTDEMVSKLSWLGNTIVKIKKENTAKISTSDKSERLEKVIAKVTAMLQEISILENGEKQLQRHYAELEQKQGQYEELKNKNFRLHEKCIQLEQEQKLYQDLAVENSALEEKVKALLSEAEKYANLADETEQLSEKLRNLEEKRDHYKTLEAEKVELQQKCSDLEKLISDFSENSLDKIKQEYKELSIKHDKCDDEYLSYRNKCNNLSESIKSLQNLCDLSAAQKAEKEKTVSELRSVVDENKKVQEQLENDRSELNREYELSLERQESIKKQIEGYKTEKFPQLQEELERVENELKAQNTEYKRLCAEGDNIIQKTETVNANIKSIEAEIQSRLDESNQKNTELEQVRTRLEQETAHLEELKNEHTSLCASIDEYSRRIELYINTKIPDSVNQINVLKNDCERYESDIAGKNRQCEQLQTTVEQLTNQNYDLTIKIDNRQEEILGLKTRTGHLEETLPKVNEQLKQLKEEHADLAKEVESRQNEISDYKNIRIPQLNQAFGEVNKELVEINEQFTEKKKRCDELRLKKSELSANLDRKREEVFDVNNDVVDMQNIYQTLEDKLSNLSDEKQSLEKELSEQKDNVSKLEGDIDRLRSSIEEMTAEAQEKQKEYFDIKFNLDSEIKKLSESCADYDSDQKNKKQKLEEYRILETKLKTAILSLDSGIREIEQTIAKYQTELESLKAKEADLNIRRQADSARVDEYQNILIPSLVEKCGKISSELEEHISDYKEKTNRLNDLTDQRDSVKNDIDARLSDIAALNSELTELRKNLANNEEHIARLSAEKQRLLTDIETYNKKIADMDIEKLKTELSRRIEERSSKQNEFDSIMSKIILEKDSLEQMTGDYQTRITELDKVKNTYSENVKSLTLRLDFLNREVDKLTSEQIRLNSEKDKKEAEYDKLNHWVKDFTTTGISKKAIMYDKIISSVKKATMNINDDGVYHIFDKGSEVDLANLKKYCQDRLYVAEQNLNECQNIYSQIISAVKNGGMQL